MIGQAISHYTIQAKIGEDGAGVLYRAIDTRQGRPVALRILSPAVIANPQWHQRVERAAVEASGLHNPHIAQILEFSTCDGMEFVAMEAPEGESAYDFLERQRPHRRHLLRITGQLVRALGAAHDAGIVHGPLNPATILISAKRQIKFYGFGFASLDPPPADEADRRSVFGESAPYVSPEQVEGAPPDVRSDIFSFGALLYHLTTSRRPFRGATISETWNAILKEEPQPIEQITSRAPKGMAKLIERCLRKNPQRRFQRIAEIRPLLEQMVDVYYENPDNRTSFFGRNRGHIAKIAGIALAGAASVAATVFWWQKAPPREPVIGSQLRQVTNYKGYESGPALSPDGTQLAYASDRNGDGNLDIWLQPADGGAPRRITDDPADDSEPAFAPSGETLAFRSERNGGGIYQVSVKGGTAQRIAPEGRRPRYSPDGKWIAYWAGPPGFAPKPGGAYKVFVVPSGGGAPRQIQPDLAFAAYPVWSPDSKLLLFAARPDATRADPDAVDWWVTALEGKQIYNTGASRIFRREGILANDQIAIPGAWEGNHIFFAVPEPTGSNIWRADSSPDSHVVSTRPLRVTSGKGMEIEPFAGSGGHLVFAAQSYNADIWGIPVSANEGRVTGQPKRWTRDPGADVAPSMTGDGAKLVFQSDRTGHNNAWSLDVASGKESPAAASAQEQVWPRVSPDGSKIAYSETRIVGFEHFYKPAGGGPAQLLCDDCGAAVSSWSRDGKMVLIDSLQPDRRLLSVSLIRIGAPERIPLFEDPQSELHQARFSPDERWIAFTAHMDGGVSRIFVAPFQEKRLVPPKEWIPLTDGISWDTGPQWSPDGKLVYFTSTRDGFRCVWAQRLDAANQPSGQAFAVAHFHTARRSPVKLPFENMDLFVARDQILVSLGETTGNIWSVKVPE